MVYVAPGPLAARLSYHTRQSIEGEVKRKLEFLFTTSKIKTGTKRKNVDSSQPFGPKKRKVSGKSSKAKGKKRAVERDDQDDSGDEDEPAIVLSDQVELEDISFLSDEVAPGPSRNTFNKNVPDEDDDMYQSIDQDFSGKYDGSTNNYAWSHSLLEEPRARFKPYSKKQTKGPNRSTMNIIQEGDNEVIMLSSD